MSPDTAQTWELPSEPVAVVHARHHLETACGDLPPGELEVARLLVTELVSNAVRHGAAPVTLVVTRVSALLRVEVHDRGTAMPMVLEHEPPAEGGAGLRLVAALATSWGADPFRHGPGKRVWFEIA